MTYHSDGHQLGQTGITSAEEIVLVYLLREVNPLVLALLLVPFLVAIAAWALRMACSFSSVKPPGFIQSTLTVLLICVANVALVFFLRYTHASPGLWSHLVAPLLTTATMIALTVRTGPLAAVITTVSFASICGGAFYSLAVLNDAVLGKILA